MKPICNDAKNPEREKAIKQWVAWLSALLWLLFLARLSSENGIATTKTSMGLTTFVVMLLHISPEQIPQINLLLRMLAHVIGFFILGYSVYIAGWTTWPYRKDEIIVSVSICGILAVLDEVKKLFISGRHLGWLDMELNITGALLGVIIAYYCMKYLRRRIRRSESIFLEMPERPQRQGERRFKNSN